MKIHLDIDIKQAMAVHNEKEQVWALYYRQKKDGMHVYKVRELVNEAKGTHRFRVSQTQMNRLGKYFILCHSHILDKKGKPSSADLKGLPQRLVGAVYAPSANTLHYYQKGMRLQAVSL